MKERLILLLLIISYSKNYGQISFEDGYYVDNSDRKIDCLIKNIDWKNNPTDFEYRLSENGEVKTGTLNSVKEFGIGNTLKYVRSRVNMDRSSEVIDKLSNSRSPDFEEVTLFLKVLIEGRANLYYYEGGEFVRFFFNSDSTKIEQLVYKSYKVSEHKIRTNNGFKNQLWNSLKCLSWSKSSVERLKYQKNRLIDFFEEYNECVSAESINYMRKEKKDLFNLTLRPGLNSSSLSIQNSISSFRDADFGDKLTLRIGVEAELIMPFNKGKWALMIEPTYQGFKSEVELPTGNSVSIDYNSIELSSGIRHYFFLNPNSKLFINGSLVFDLGSDSEIDFESGTDLVISTSPNYAFGLGYKYGDRIGLELRYQTSRDVLSSFPLWDSDYQTFSVILGYSFL